MRLKSTTCRQQEAIQLALAESEPLETRRKVATAAAKAWGLEAVEAEKRESVNEATPSKLDAAITLEFADEAAKGDGAEHSEDGEDSEDSDDIGD